jgi:hypothetical protein
MTELRKDSRTVGLIKPLPRLYTRKNKNLFHAVNYDAILPLAQASTCLVWYAHFDERHLTGPVP